jgi:hypothetical protein
MSDPTQPYPVIPGQPIAPDAVGQPAKPALGTGAKVVLAVVGGLLVLCCIGGLISLGDTDEKKAGAGASSPVPSLVLTTTPETTPPTTEPTPSPEPTSPSPVATTTAPKPATAKVPNLRGENAAVAKDALERLGFTNIEFGSADKNDTWVVLPQNWTVKKQSAAAGKKLPLDALIVLTCTKQG